MKVLNLVTLCVLTSACATGFNPRYYYSDIEIDNLTGETLRNVRVQVGPGGRVLECAEVTKDRICQQRIGKHLYPKAEVRLSWQTEDGRQMSAQENPSVPLTLVYSQPIRLMMEIAADGSAKFYFKQDDLFIGE